MYWYVHEKSRDEPHGPYTTREMAERVARRIIFRGGAARIDRDWPARTPEGRRPAMFSLSILTALAIAVAWAMWMLGGTT